MIDTDSGWMMWSGMSGMSGMQFLAVERELVDVGCCVFVEKVRKTELDVGWVIHVECLDAIPDCSAYVG